MPLWTPVEVVGLLLRDTQGLILRPDGGGEWRLDAPAKHFALANQRVRVTGVRSGFNQIDVQTMEKVRA